MRATSPKDLEVPAPTPEELRAFRALRRVFDRGGREPDAHEDNDELADDELVALSGHLIDFALKEWEGGRSKRNSAVPCIAANLAFQARRTGGKPVASIMAARLKDDEDVEKRMRAFLSEVGQPADEWRERLELLARDGNYSAAFGSKGRNRISRADCDNEFVPAFRRYLIGLPTISKRQRERYLLALSTLMTIFIAGCGGAAAVSTGIVVGGVAKAVKVLSALLATAFGVAALVYLLSRCTADSGSGAPDATPDGKSHEDVVIREENRRDEQPWPIDAGPSPDGAHAGDCWSESHEYRIRNCLMREADDRKFASPEAALALFRETLTVGRWNYVSVPELASARWPEHQYDLQQIRAHEGIAAVHFREGRIEAARDEYRKALELRNRLPKERGLATTRRDCFLMITLERRAGSLTAAAEARDRCNAAASSDMYLPYVFEWARVDAAQGAYATALYYFTNSPVDASRQLPPTNDLAGRRFDEEWPGLRSVDELATEVFRAFRELEAQGAAIELRGLRTWIWYGPVPESQGSSATMFVIMPSEPRCLKDGPRRETVQAELTIGRRRPHALGYESAYPLPIVVPRSFRTRHGRVRIRIQPVQPPRSTCTPEPLDLHFCVGRDGRLSANPSTCPAD